MTEEKRKIVVPGETIVEGDDYLPGENTEKRNNKVISIKYGLAEEVQGLVKVIPLSGTYLPRRGNVIIGRVENVLFNGWILDIKSTSNGFLSVAEYPRYLDKNSLDEAMDIGDLAVVKIYSINKRGVDLTLKSRGLGKIDEGVIIEVNPNKVPRIIGKEGSMVGLIKEKTGCNITVGQNGIIWIQGENIEGELLARKAVEFVAANSFISGLTEKVEKWFEENGGKK